MQKTVLTTSFGIEYANPDIAPTMTSEILVKSFPANEIRLSVILERTSAILGSISSGSFDRLSKSSTSAG